MFLGIIIFRHRYSLNKFISVLFITTGLILCTIEDYRLKRLLSYRELLQILTNTFYAESSSVNSVNNSDNNHFSLKTVFGIIALTISFLLAAGTGIYQEYLAKNFPKNPNESLFYVV